MLLIKKYKPWATRRQGFMGLYLLAKQIQFALEKLTLYWLSQASCVYENPGSLYVSGKLPTYPSPKPTLTLNFT